MLMRKRAVIAAGEEQGSPSTLSFIDSSESSAASITLPLDIEEGDILVLAQRAQNASGLPSLVTPGGWTTPTNGDANNGSDTRMMLSYKIAEGNEGGTSVTGMSGDSVNRKLAMVYRGDTPAKSISASDFNRTFTDVNPASQSTTSGTGSAPIIVLGSYGSTGIISPRTMTPAATHEVGHTATDFYYKGKVYNASDTPADVTVDMDDEGTRNSLQVGYLEVT